MSEKNNARLLLVDDDLAVLKLFAEYLGSEFKVETALSAQKALDKISVEEYHLVITDLVMP
jgi:DNA-binding NtrC family response regulator